MKHIKEFKIFEGEYYTDEDIKKFKDNLPIFAKFMKKIIINFGYKCVDFSENNDIMLSFYLKKDEKILFSIMTGDDEYFVLESFNKSNNYIIESIPEYMKTINGIKFNKQVGDSEYEFYIPDDINYVINQISNEKILMFASSQKYNV